MSDKLTADAADALCDLNTAHAIMAICEASIFRTDKGQKFASKLTRLCLDHGAQQLRDYDKGRAAAQDIAA